MVNAIAMLPHGIMYEVAHPKSAAMMLFAVTGSHVAEFKGVYSLAVNTLRDMRCQRLSTQPEVPIPTAQKGKGEQIQTTSLINEDVGGLGCWGVSLGVLCCILFTPCGRTDTPKRGAACLISALDVIKFVC